MLVAIAAGFVAGIASQLLWPVLPSLTCLVLAGSVGSLALLRVLPCRSTIALVPGLVAGAALGMAWAAFVAGGVLDARLPEAVEGVAMEVEGDVGDLRQHADGSIAFTLRVSRLPWRRDGELPAGAGLRLSAFDPLPVADGERWRLVVRLRRPHAAVNPGGADFERILFGDRVVATGSVVDNPRNERLRGPRALRAVRARLLSALPPLYGAGPGDIAADEATRFARAVLPALLLDDRSLLTAAHWRVLADTGTAHLVAISGLHVSLLWGSVLVMLAGLRGRWTGARRYDAWSVVPAFAVALFYAAAAGMPLPAERAVWMLGLASLFVLWSGELPGWRVLLLTTALVLARDPLAVHGAGFWLSHGAVAILILVADLHRRSDGAVRWRRWLAETLTVQLAVTLLLVPPLLALFGSASLSSLLANLPAGPLVNLAALPAGLLAVLVAPLSPTAANGLVDVACAALSWLWAWLAWVDGIGAFAPWRAEGLSFAALLALALALLLAWIRPFGGALAAVVVLLCAAWPRAPSLLEGDAEACVLDAGQGLAVLVRTRAHAVLFDAGPGGDGTDAGSRVVAPAARALGVSRLDLLVLADDDVDHAGGAPGVIAARHPREVVSGSASLLERLATPGTVCRSAGRRRYDGVDFLLLPGVDGTGDRHDRGCVLRVGGAAGALLLPGDVSARRELDLVADYRDALRADVLVATRHGSRVAGTATFLDTVRPAHVLFATGYRNRFGYPHDAIVAAAARRDATRWNTALDGALCLRLGDGSPGVRPRAARDHDRRFWRDGSRARRAGEGRGLVVD